MSRFLGSIWKKSRSLGGFSLLENGKEFSRGRKSPPGQHGKSRKRKPSIYAYQNKEKQKLRFLYGLRERQLRNLFISVKKKKGNALYNLMTHLESRLDNLVFRSGLLGTRKLARQWVNHGHLLVNEEKVDIPSFLVKPGSTISLKEKMANHEIVKAQLQQNIKPPAYISLDKKNSTIAISYSRYPTDEELEKNIDVSSVIEWYNKKM